MSIALVDAKDGLVMYPWQTQYNLAGRAFPTSFPLRCQACGKDVYRLDNKTGEKVLYEGARTLMFSNGAGQVNEFQVNVTAGGKVERIRAASSEMVVY